MVRRPVTKSAAGVAADYGLSVRTVRKGKHRYAVVGKIDGIGHPKAETRQAKRRKPGWECLHVCVDAAARQAYTAIHAEMRAPNLLENFFCAQ